MSGPVVKNPRYDGKPLLRLLECYVLAAIDALSADELDKLAALEPNLRKTYRMEGSWLEIIAAVMEFPSTMPDLIRERWARNTEIARENRTTLAAQQFAEMFVDANLSW